MHRDGRRTGMTLLEVVVALTVAASALVAGASVLGFLSDQQARTETQTLVSAQAMRATLRDWIAEARLTTEGDAEFRGDSSALSFVTSAPTPVAANGTIVRLIDDGGLVAELQPWRIPGERMRLPIGGSASRVRLRYLESAAGERRWRREWTSTSVLPAVVEVRMEFDSDTGGTESARRALLAIPMTITLTARR
jgi:prepilin-type N-terminal cleavage/methylation domain-containing protein